jgi:hypothetical protein
MEGFVNWWCHLIGITDRMAAPTDDVGRWWNAMQFIRVVSPVEDMEIWNASSNGFS